MSSWCESKCQATQNPDEAVVDIADRGSVGQLSDDDWPRSDDNDRRYGTCMLCAEDEKFTNDSISSKNNTHLEELCSSVHDLDYVEKINEFQFYVDKVKGIARPGCSTETLDVALRSVSSLLKTLAVISSKQYVYSSL